MWSKARNWWRRWRQDCWSRANNRKVTLARLLRDMRRRDDKVHRAQAALVAGQMGRATKIMGQAASISRRIGHARRRAES